MSVNSATLNGRTPRESPPRMTFTGAIGAVGAEVVADPVPQRPGLADVNGLALRVEVQIHSGLLGQPRDLFLEFVDGHTVL